MMNERNVTLLWFPNKISQRGGCVVRDFTFPNGHVNARQTPDVEWNRTLHSYESLSVHLKLRDDPAGENRKGTPESVPFRFLKSVSHYFFGAGAAVVAGIAGAAVVAAFAGAAFFSAAGAAFAFAGAAFSFAGAVVVATLAGATVVAGDAGAGFCCAMATATKATNVSKPTIRTILFILCYLLFWCIAGIKSKRSAKIRFNPIFCNLLILLGKVFRQKDQAEHPCCKKLHDFPGQF